MSHMSDLRNDRLFWLSKLAVGVCLAGVLVSVSVAEGPGVPVQRAFDRWQATSHPDSADVIGSPATAFDVNEENGLAGGALTVDDVPRGVTGDHRIFLPSVRWDAVPTPVPADLVNGGFEADWEEEESHDVLIFPIDGDPYRAVMGNVFTPPGWLTWYRHGKPVEHDPRNDDGWVQPEVKDAWVHPPHDPARVHSGEKAIHMFKTWGVFDGGLLQSVSVEPGARLRLSAFAHAWSSQRDDARWSEGPGNACGFKLEGETHDDDWRNFTFWVGVDPLGGQNPYAESVVWGWGAHIYNCHDEVPYIEVVAEHDTVTVFLRTRTLWPFKHNNAYWDDVTLEIIP